MDTGRACVSTLGTAMPARWVAAVELLCLAALGALGYLRHLSLAGVEPLASTTRAVRARELLMAAAGLDVLVAVGNRVGLTPGTFQLARLLRPAVAVLWKWAQQTKWNFLSRLLARFPSEKERRWLEERKKENAKPCLGTMQ